MSSNVQRIHINDSLLGPESINNDSIFRIINEEKARRLVPAILYIALLMILGLVGNSLVCYFFTFREKKTTNSCFIVMLAVYDLIVCTIDMPTEIAEIVLLYTIENDVACKILKFITFYAGVASILTLVAIAADRFKRICRAVGPQINIVQARRFSLILVSLAIVLSLPSLFLFGTFPVTVGNDYGLDIYGRECTLTNDSRYHMFVRIYLGIQIVFLFLLSFVLIIIYCFIGRTLYEYRKRLIKHRYADKELSVTVTSSSNVRNDKRKQEMNEISFDSTGFCETGIAETTGDCYLTDVESNTIAKQLQTNETRSEKIPVTRKPADKNTPISCNAKPRQHILQGDAETVRVTIAMLLVTVLFIASYLPYLTLNLWREAIGQHGSFFLEGGKVVAFNIGIRSCLLNNSLNPWIYGFLNKRFRKFYFGWCYRK